jgi:hypothetical protein
LNQNINQQLNLNENENQQLNLNGHTNLNQNINQQLNLNENENQQLNLNVNTNQFSNQQLQINLSKIEHLQTQLITARNKPKTFYISLNSRFSHILKFPLSQNDINKLILSDNIKQLFNLIPSNIQSIQVIDFENSSLGIIMTNFNNQIDPNNTIIKSSKLENEVMIYNGNHFHFEWNDLYKLTHDEQIKYLKVLAFRYIIGTNDTNNRNILKIQNEIISIDDPVLYIPPKMVYRSPIPKNYRQIFAQILNSNFNEIQKWLKEIKMKINDTFCIQQIDKLMNINNWVF